MDKRKRNRGFTLIEILIVIGMIAILASVVLIAINPLRQFAQARNSQRISNVNAILNAVGNRTAEHKGIFTDTSGLCQTPIPTTETAMSGSAFHGFDIRPCLVPTYISELPYDPVGGSNSCTTDSCSGELYDTRYTIKQDTNGRITVCAPNAGNETSIEGSAPYCLTR
ncbi:MAG: type II secretion system protein [Candidatus Paceibacterota bacterium]